MRRHCTPTPSSLVPFAQRARILLLLALFAQLLFSSLDKSLTIDEPNHLTRGYAYLVTGDLRLSRDEGHPPLFNLICAMPLALIRDLELPTDRPSWQTGFRNAFAIEFLFGKQAALSGALSLEQIALLGRLPVMLATLCLAALVARWADDLYGAWGSVVALAFCAFDPNLIAHGRLATTDMGITLFTLSTLYLFWRFLGRPTWPLLIWTGIALGLAQGTKFSALSLLPLMGSMGLLEALYPRGRLSLPERFASGRLPRRLSALAALFAVMVALLVLAGLTLWAIYGFGLGRPSVWPMRVPAPEYLEGLGKTLAHAADFGHPAFLMGRRSTEGWWYYFPVAFALKTPLPSLIALLCALLSRFWIRWSNVDWRREAPLIAVPAIYFASSMLSVLNIGYRHLLPILPFLWVYVGRLGPWIERLLSAPRKTWKTSLVLGSSVAFGAWLIVGTLSVAPHYLAYFNAAAGGPDGGWRYLVDSNLDWGQDLPSLKRYIDGREDTMPVYLSWFGCTYPHLYGLSLTYRLLPSHLSYPYPGDAARSSYNPLHPAPGLYAIGATNLNGVGLAAGDVFERFRGQEPVARVGHSIHIYQIGEQMPSVGSTCISQLRFKDLSLQTEAVSLGRGPGAVKWFNLESSYILPAEGDAAYVLPEPPLPFAPAWQGAFLARAEIAHTQTEGERTPSGRALPGATVYHLNRRSADDLRETMLATILDAPKGWSPSLSFGSDAATHAIDGPAHFDHGLEFVGYLLASGETLRPGEILELITVWRSLGEMPPEASDLRVFVHLLDDQSLLWGGEDRLDLHPPTWEAGDLLVQYHRVPLAAGARPGVHQVEIGLYAAITMERLALRVDGAPIADRLLLQPIRVLAR
jgi:hypothetical protein